MTKHDLMDGEKECPFCALGWVCSRVFIIFLILAVIPFSHAALTDDVLAAYLFENDLTDEVASWDLTGTNIAYSTGYHNNGLLFSTDGTARKAINTDLDTEFGTAYTICMMFNTTSASASYNIHLWSGREVNANLPYGYIRQTDEAPASHIRGWYTNSEFSDTAGVVNTGAWIFYCVIIDTVQNDFITYVDGSVDENQSITDNLIPTALVVGTVNGDDTDANQDWEGEIDSLTVWNRTLSISELDQIYNSGTVLEYPFGEGGSPPNATGGTPNLLWSFTNNSNFNSGDVPFRFNFSTWCDNDCAGTFNITVTRTNRTGNFAEQVTPQTYNLVNLNLSEAWLHPYWIYQWSDFEGQLNWTIEIVPNHENDTGVNETYFLYVDTINVDITGQGALYGRDTTTSFYRNVDQDVLNWSLEFSDTNLYYANHTIEYWGPDGSSFNTTINTTESYNLSLVHLSNLTVNLQSLADGVYKVIGIGKDAHTKVNITEMDFFWLPDGSLTMEGLTFEPGFKQLTGRGDPATYFYYAGDRYKLKVTFEESALEHSFNMSMPGWDYVGERYGYKGHFVNIYTDRWWDTMGENVKSVDVVSLGSDRYEITVHHFYETDEIEFESLGIINTKTTTWTINVSNGYTFSAINPALDNIENFTITISNSTSIIQQKTATGQNVSFNITSGQYYSNITVSGYIDNSTDLLTFSLGGSFQYNLFALDTFYILFKDEVTQSVINGTLIDLDIISDSYAENFSTSDGTLTINVSTPENYTFRYGAPGYQYRLSDFQLLNNSYEVLTLFLLQSASNVTIKVIDQVQDVVEDATINIYRYSTLTNSYNKVNSINTDFQGRAIVDMTLNSEFYYFTIYYDSQLKKQTSPAYVTATELIFGINIDEVVLEDYFNINEIDGYLTFNPNTHTFRFFYNDPNSVVSQGCLYVYTTTFAGDTLYNSSCVSASGATLLGGVVASNGTSYLAKGYVTYDGEQTLLDSLIWTYGESIQSGNLGYFLVIILTIVFLFIGYWSLELSFILTPLPTVFASTGLLNIIPIPTATAIGLMVVGVALAIIANKYSR